MSLGGLSTAGRQGGVEWGSKRQRAAIERVERLCGGVSVVTGTNGNIEVVSPIFFRVLIREHIGRRSAVRKKDARSEQL